MGGVLWPGTALWTIHWLNRARRRWRQTLMTVADIAVTITNMVVYFIFYFVSAFGSGFIIGILLSNLLKGRGQPTYMKLYSMNIEEAAKHNSQWHPTNDRWQK